MFNRIFNRILEEFLIRIKKLISSLVWKPRDESFEPN